MMMLSQLDHPIKVYCFISTSVNPITMKRLCSDFTLHIMMTPWALNYLTSISGFISNSKSPTTSRLGKNVDQYTITVANSWWSNHHHRISTKFLCMHHMIPWYWLHHHLLANASASWPKIVPNTFLEGLWNSRYRFNCLSLTPSSLAR